MTYILHDYQQRTVDAVRRREAKGKFRCCLSAPTGSGKTLIAADLLGDSDKRQILFTHRKTLFDQLARTLDAAAVPYGRLASGYKADPSKPVQLAMVQTATKRLEQLLSNFEPFDRVLIDEFHCLGGPTWLYLFETLHSLGASIIGFSATPDDLGGRVDGVHQVVTVTELIQRGILTPPIVFGCGAPDLEALDRLKRQANGEYSPADINKLVKPQVIFGQVLAHRRRLCPDNRPFFLFAHSVKASIWWAQHLTLNGCKTAHIDGDDVWVDGAFYKSDTAARTDVFARLEGGDLEGCSNRFVMREGVDVPAVGHIIVTAPVALRRTWVQMCGRGMRAYNKNNYHKGPLLYDKQSLIVQDHSGSCLLHPELDSDEPFDWTLPSGVAERARIKDLRDEKIQEPITCPQCMNVRMAGDTCPYCGYRSTKKCRFVIETNGQLKLVHGKLFKSRKISHKPGDEKLWEKSFWAARKNNQRTPEQVYAWIAYKNNWRWLRRDLPLMPREAWQWFIPCRDIPMDDLIPKEVTA